MADDPNQPPRGDNFGWGQQPLHRTDETTGDEGIEPPVGEGHDEAAMGSSREPSERPDEPRVPGYPDAARGPDSQE